MGWLDNIFAAMQNEANSQEGFNEKNKWVDLSSQAAGSVEGDMTGASQVPSKLGDFSVPAAGSVEGDVSGAFPTPTNSHPQTQHSVDYSKLPSYYSGLLDDYPEELDSYNYNTGLGYDPTMLGWWTPPASEKDIDIWTANTDTDPGLYLEEYYPVAKTQKSDFFTQGLAEAQNKRARSAAKNSGNEEALKNLEEEKKLWENNPEWIKEQEEKRNQLLANVGRSSSNQSSSQEGSQESSGSNNNSSTPYISAEERYPTNDNAQNYYNYLVNNYGEDAFNSLAITPETLFQAYQEMMNGDWDSLYSFRKGASADEKNAYMELLANIYPELYQDYFDEQGNFINPWTDEPEYIDFTTIEQNPEWMFLASGLDSAKALAADMQAAGLATQDTNGQKISVDDLATQLLVDAAIARMQSNQAGFDAQTYRDVIQMLNPGVTDELSVGKYEPGGTYSANYNTSFGDNDIDWDAILSAPTYNDRINAIEGLYKDRKNFTQDDLQDWFALAALASGVAADRQYRRYEQNKEQ